MVVRLEVQRPSGSQASWQLRRCRVQRGAMMEDVRDPAVWLSMEFDSLEEAVREAKRATFTYLQLKRHKDMPDQIDWRIMDQTHLFPCPQCEKAFVPKSEARAAWQCLRPTRLGMPSVQENGHLED